MILLISISNIVPIRLTVKVKRVSDPLIPITFYNLVVYEINHMLGLRNQQNHNLLEPRFT